MIFRVSLRTVKVFSPKASILIKPMSAASSISMATTGILVSCPVTDLVSIGATLEIGIFDVTTPAAWIPVPRIRPRNCPPYCSISGYFSRNHATFFDIMYSSHVSMVFRARFTSERGTFRQRATSRTTPLSLNCRKVAIEATCRYCLSR